MKITILSHFRSGLFWLIEILKRNIPDFEIYPYNNFGHLNVERKPDVAKAILLVRDGRDSLVSSYIGNTYRAYNEPKWEESSMWRDKTFSEVLKWKYRKVLNHKKKVLQKLNPVEYWVKYNQDWLEDKTIKKILVRYEDLLTDQENVVKDIKVFYRLPIGEIKTFSNEKGATNRNVPEMDNYKPRTAGSWKRVFSEADNDYFMSIAGDLMKRLGYV